MTKPLLERLAAEAAAADCGPDEAAAAPDAAGVVAALRRAADAVPSDESAALAAFDEAGALHDVEVLDAALRELTGWRFLGFLTVGTRRRLRDAARVALRRTTRPGTLRIAAAFVGELGGAEDAGDLETVARHPSFVLHGATALSNLRSRRGREALLRVLHAHTGDERVTVIDRLLPHALEPAVRLALVRDALTGLDDAHARQVAPDIARLCNVRSWLDSARTPDDVREGGRRVLALS